MYGPDTARVYDDFYHSLGKDYVAEAQVIADVVARLNPSATSLLDVACGTGEHLRHLVGRFDVAGVELSKPMVEVARRKLPDVEFHVGDMRSFDLGRTFDVVTCMFSAIGYSGSVAGLGQTVASMAAHLRPGGVVIVESSFWPKGWIEGHLAHHVFVSDDKTILRLSHSSRAERIAILDMQHLIGDAAGIKHFRERHELYMFDVDEYESAFENAGLSVRLEPDLLRGLYVGVATDG
ncbi:class I SAM-dependent methyltransferase [Stackebrandtia soli]|uniref:class I SAM-dependent methyltransferase n=1 Tax=Stackebrandtia soli TaxID=1892856 RepID=UPI0039E7DAAF